MLLCASRELILVIFKNEKKNKIFCRKSLIFYEVYNVIQSRKKEQPEGSYVATLFDKGLDKILKKVGEEAVELIIEAKDNNDDLFLNEAADLIYHLLVLFSAKGFKLEDVTKVLKSRHG